MKKMFKPLNEMLKAIKYSLLFSWRNARAETIGITFATIISSLVAWFAVDATGIFITKTEFILKSGISTGWFYHLLPPILYLLFITVLDALMEILNWYSNINWRRKLRFANMREVNLFKSTLDAATLRSQKYDDLYVKISNSDYGFDERMHYVDVFKEFATYFSKFVVFGVGLFMYSPYYALILFIPVLVVGINAYVFQMDYIKAQDEAVPLNKKRSVLERVFARPVSLIQSQSYNQTKKLIEVINTNTKQVLSITGKHMKKGAIREALARTFFALVYTGVIVSVFKNVIDGVFDLGSAVVIVVAIQSFKSSLEIGMESFAVLSATSKYILTIEEEFFKLKPSVKTENPIEPKFKTIPKITISDIHFAYPGTRKEVIKGLDLTIEPNSKIIIVGESGCGKSTLMQLLQRHYDPTKGEIYVNDIKLRNIEPEKWFNILSAQMQEYEIFERKVFEEIASSEFDMPADLKKAKWAAGVASCDTFIMESKDGYDTQIGTGFGGMEFSGGEKQRIAVARTIYRDTPILILDEPDAKLDPINASKLFENVLKMKNKTVIVVSHKVSRAHLFDNIIVIKDGVIAEMGAHDDLFEKKGEYYELLMAEKSKKDDDETDKIK